MRHSGGGNGGDRRGRGGRGPRGGGDDGGGGGGDPPGPEAPLAPRGECRPPSNHPRLLKPHAREHGERKGGGGFLRGGHWGGAGAWEFCRRIVVLRSAGRATRIFSAIDLRPESRHEKDLQCRHASPLSCPCTTVLPPSPGRSRAC